METTYKAPQIIAGSQIYEKLRNNRYCLLYAHLQSGKTGTYNYVIKKCLDAKLIEKVWIVCGMSETKMKEQAQIDAIMYNNNYIDKIDVYFRTQFKKMTPNNIDIRNTLIVIDESHIDQDENNEMCKMFLKHGIRLDGDFIKLNDLNVYIVSVSATPYSEISNIVHYNSYNKDIVRLTPGEGYKGIEDYYNNKKIKAIFDITTDNGKTKFTRIVKEKGCSYNIVRCLNTYDTLQSIYNICKKNEFNYYEYFEDNDRNVNKYKVSDIDSILEVKPTLPTVIVIKGLLRAGKTINKKYIGFVWENSKLPHTDTILQGLPGRVCGYHNYNINIYISKNLLAKRVYGNTIMSEIDRYICSHKSMNNENRLENITTIPTLAKNIMKTQVSRVYNKPRNATSAIRIIKNELDFERLNNDGEIKRSIINKLKESNYKRIRESNINEGQKNEVMNILDTYKENEITFRKFKKNGERTQYKGLLRCFKESVDSGNIYVGNQGDRGDRMMSIVIAGVYRGYDSLCGANEGDIYVVFYTKKSQIRLEEANLEARIPGTIGNEIFNKAINKDEIELEGNQNKCISNDNMDYGILDEKTRLFIGELNNRISEWKDNKKNKNRYRGNKKSLISNIYFNIEDNMNPQDKRNRIWEIVKDIEEKYEVNIMIKFSRGRINKSDVGYKKVLEVVWE